MRRIFTKSISFRFVSYALGLFLCVFPSLTLADSDDFCTDNPSIPIDARLHCKSGIFYFDKSDHEKAYEMFQHAVKVYPGYDIVKKKMNEIELIINKKKLNEKKISEQKRLDEERISEQKRLNEQRISEQKKQEQIRRDLVNAEVMKQRELQRQANAKEFACLDNYEECISRCARKEGQAYNNCNGYCLSMIGKCPNGKSEVTPSAEASASTEAPPSAKAQPLAKASPHTAYGPHFVGYNDYIRVDLDTACNVFAVNSYNYDLYKRGENFSYFGGNAKKSPVILSPPTGTYYVIIDNGGESYSLKASVHIISR